MDRYKHRDLFAYSVGILPFSEGSWKEEKVNKVTIVSKICSGFDGPLRGGICHSSMR